MNLLHGFNELAGDQLGELVGGLVGETTDVTNGALGAILPSLLGGLMNKASDETESAGLIDFIGKNDLGGGMLDNLEGLLGSTESSGNLMGMGSTIMKYLMGNKTDAMIDVITRITGLNNTKIGSIIRMAAPLFISYIGKKIKSDGLGAAGLFKLLSSQKDYVKESAPPGLLDSLGFRTFGLSDKVEQASDTLKNAGNEVADRIGDALKNTAGSITGSATDLGSQAVEKGKSGFSKILPWIGILLILMVLVYFLRGCGGQATEASNNMIDKTSSAMEAASATSNAIANAFKSFSLPNGKQIKTTTGSFIDNINSYVSSSKSDPNNRFTFDKVTFKSGSAMIAEESEQQLLNLVNIMDAYPNIEIRVEGHTDNTGKAETNQRISNQRALVVKKYLMDQGIGAQRVTAVGFGQTKPIASNANEEGRERNRRVDVFVLNK
jgi:outer membrane protein OmpA-like peptidoglycan-associated protein